MAEHPNVTLIRRGFAAFNTGDMATLTEIIATDCVQHMPGNNRFSGEHKGRDDMLAMYGQMAELTGGQFAAELEDVYANDHRVVAIYRAKGTRNSRTINERHALCFELLDGKAIDLDDIALDGKVDDEFWA
jgi:ketosteroid isomerase-like protein